MSRRKLLLIAIIFFIVVMGILILVFSKPGNVSKNTVPLSLIPSQVQGTLPIKSEIKESDFKFTNALPILEKKQNLPLNESEANNIASKFGFSSSPIKTQDAIGGQTYIWSDDKNSLVVYANTRQVDYSLNIISQVANKQLSDEAISSTAQEFLNKNFGLDTSKAIFANISYINTTNETSKQTTKENANIYQVNFSPVQLDFKFLSINPQLPPIAISILKDGTVAKAHVVLLDEINKSSQNYRIKNYEQFQSEIGNAVLINIDEGNLNAGNIKSENITNITIQKAELVYLLDDNKGSFYQPIFYLTGTIQLKGSTNKLSAQLYLPAIQN